MTQQNNILSVAAKNLLLVDLKGIGGWTPNARLKDASRVLAETYGGSERAFKGTENLLPSPHDEEYKEMKSAYGTVRAAFYLATMPYGSSVDAKTGKAKADGKRAVVASKIVDGSFLQHMQSLLVDLEARREVFAMALPDRIEKIRNESALGSQFDATRYPSQDDVRRGWYYESILPEPILDASAVNNMGLPPEVARMIEDNLTRKVESQVQFGQQQLVNETLKHVKSMVVNLTKLNAYFNGQHEGKRPAIFDSLIDNVGDSLEKLRTYALPGTVEGDAVLALVDGIEERLDMDNVDATEMKKDAKVAAKVLKGATEATKLIDAWSGTSTVFDEPQRTAKPEPTVQVNPLGDLDMDAMLDGFDEEEESAAMLGAAEDTLGAPVTFAPDEEPEPAPKVEEEDEVNDLLKGW